jgi:hypothetical protein
VKNHWDTMRSRETPGQCSALLGLVNMKHEKAAAPFGLDIEAMRLAELAVRKLCHWREAIMTFKGWGVATAAAAMLVGFAPGGGHAATETNFLAKSTGDVVALCSPQSNSVLDNAGINFCDGFAQGVVLTEQQHEAGPRGSKFFCLPDPAPTRNDAMAGFVKWANTSPDRLNMPAVDGLISFLRDSYPCPKHR